MAKYKFILTLPNDYEIDSQYDIEGHVAWPNWSQAEPVRYRGVFDTFEQAKEYASTFEVYTYLAYEDDDTYDYFEDECACGTEEAPCFVSMFDAEDAACAYLGISPGDTKIAHPEYCIEPITEGDPEREIPAGTYKYTLHYDGECLLDSLEEYDEFFDTYEEAQEMAEEASQDYDIDTDEPLYDVEPIEILNIEIVEADEEDED